MNLSTAQLLEWLVRASYLLAATLLLLGWTRSIPSSPTPTCRW